MSSPWQNIHLPECDSTFNVARNLPPWTVVSCTRQTQGRGRFNRAWFADEGGLWASYNLPIDPAAERNWGLLPLVAGAALVSTLAPCSIPGLRLRWPNDVLVGRSKLAGILVERPRATQVAIGIGINVHNNTAALAERTQDPPVRLADLIPACPPAETLREMLAEQLTVCFQDFCQRGLPALAPLLDAAWGESRPVVLITDTERICGFFAGIEPDGSPVLRQADGSLRTVPAISVMRLKELL